MDKRTMTLVVSIFFLIVAGMFIYAYLKSGEIVQTVPNITKEEISPYASIERIDAKHFFIDGVHTFAGEVTLPTPCDLLEVDTLVMESYPEKIQLNFNVINNSESCAQVITNQRFIATAEASSEAEASAVFMGRTIQLNLIPAAAGETPAEFELYIKG